jgi:hypothetical protein
MSSYHGYNRNGYNEQNQNRNNEGKGDIDPEKLEYYQIQKQLELEKERQNLSQKQQFEDYPNYSNQRPKGLYEDKNNIKFEGEDRDRRMNYYNQMDNLYPNPTKNDYTKPTEDLYNFPTKNYQRGHGYNIITGEILPSPKSPNSNDYNQAYKIKSNYENNNISKYKGDERFKREDITYNNIENNQKISYHKVPAKIPSEPKIKNDNKIQYNILDSRNEYWQNKQKNMISFDDIFKGKKYPKVQYKEKNENDPKYGKAEKQREYAKFLEGQINAKRIYEETIRNLSKNSEPERERYINRNLMIFGGMNPYTNINRNKTSNSEYHQYINRRQQSERFQNNGSNIIG